jgi:quinol monooxygenase YgiN
MLTIGTGTEGYQPTQEVEMRPMMIVDCLWKTPRKPMTPGEEKEYNHWCDEVHIPDLLRDTGMVRVTRYRDRDGAGIFYIQEFESEEALEKYLVSERRKELRRKTETHYRGARHV